MPVTILGDTQVSDLLHSLTASDVRKLHFSLACTLHDYSTGPPSITNQPERIAAPTSNGTTALFMPSVGTHSVGVKVVCLNPSSDSSAITNPSSANKSDELPSTRPRGTLTLLDHHGMPRGWMSATTLTAFRTALATNFLFEKRARVHTLVVFGAGAQAYWHIRLALLLRGSDIHHVHIVSRTFETASKLFRTILSDERWEPLRRAYKGGKENVEFTLLSGEFGEYQRVLKERVRAADAIFGCTPSTEPLFPSEWLTSAEGRRKAKYIGLVGSYKPEMVELHPDVLRHQVGKDRRGEGEGKEAKRKWHVHKHAERGGVIVVDSLEACMKEAGEVIQAGLGGEDLVELGELVMVRRKEREEAEAKGAQSAESAEIPIEQEGSSAKDNSGLKKWVEGGNVVYKSVGIGLMDICVGSWILERAREMGVGTTIEDF